MARIMSLLAAIMQVTCLRCQTVQCGPSPVYLLWKERVVSKTEDVCGNAVVRRQAARPVKLEYYFGGVKQATFAISGSVRCVAFSFCVADFLFPLEYPLDVALAIAISRRLLCAPLVPHITNSPLCRASGATTISSA